MDKWDKELRREIRIFVGGVADFFTTPKEFKNTFDPIWNLLEKDRKHQRDLIAQEVIPPLPERRTHYNCVCCDCVKKMLEKLKGK